MSRYARRTDASQGEIVATLRRLGFEVRDLSRAGGGCPDLLVARDGRIWCVEAKTARTQYGKRLSDRQAEWARGWPAPTILRTSDEALAWALARRAESSGTAQIAPPPSARAVRTARNGNATPETS